MKTAMAAVFLLLVPQAFAQAQSDPPSAVAGCVQCHTEAGLPALPGWPRLAGKDRDWLVDVLRGHRNSLVPDSTMDKVAAGLDDAQIEAAADYFSGLAPTDPPPFDFDD